MAGKFPGGGTHASKAQEIGKPYVFPEQPVLEHWEFKGWWTLPYEPETPDPEYQRIWPGDPFQENSAQSLFAKWEQHTVDVTFTNGGQTETITELAGNNYVLPAEPTSETKEFAGW